MKNIECVSGDVVVVGSFGSNPYMNTDWLAGNLLKPGKDEKIALSINLDGLTIEPSFTVGFNGFEVEAHRNRMVFRHSPFSTDAFDEIERMVKTFAELLPHTACTAFGVNFEFRGAFEENEDILALPFIKIKDGEIVPYVTAGYKLGETDMMNITCKKGKADSEAIISFNFDTKLQALNNVPLALALKNKIFERPISLCYDKALFALGCQSK